MATNTPRRTVGSVSNTAGIPSNKDYIDFIGKAVDLWDRLPEPFKGVRKKDSPLFLYVYPLVGCAINSAKAALVLFDRQMNAQSAPLVRLAFESALTAQRVASTGDYEEFRSHLARKSQTSLHHTKEAGYTIPEDIIRRIESMEVELSPVLSTMIKLCKTINKEQGEWLYYMYSRLCEHCHPSIGMVSSYTRVTGGGTMERQFQGLSKNPETDPREFIRVLAMAVALALSPLTDIFIGKPYRKTIENLTCHLTLPIWVTEDGKPPPKYPIRNPQPPKDYQDRGAQL